MSGYTVTDVNGQQFRVKESQGELVIQQLDPGINEWYTLAEFDSTQGKFLAWAATVIAQQLKE